MKKKILSVALLLGAVVLLLCGCGFFVENVYRYDDASSYEGVEGDFSVEGIAGAEGFSSIEIDWIAGDIKIVQRTDGHPHAIRIDEEFPKAMKQEEYAQLSFKTRIKDGKLSVKYAKSGAKIPNNFQKTLIVEIPPSIELDSIEVDTVSANVTITEISVRELSVDTVSGAISMSDTATHGISVDTVSGNATISRCTFSEVEFDSVSGDAEIVFAEAVGFRCKFETVSGRFVDGFGAEKNGGVYTYGDGSVRINADTVSGNVTLSQLDSE